MSWHKIEGNASVMLEAQWIFRCCNAPAISLKRDGEVAARDAWVASLLCLTGISTVVMHMQGSTLPQAQAEAEAQLREMGWSWT